MTMKSKCMVCVVAFAAMAGGESDDKDGYIRFFYDETISETEHDGYTEIEWAHTVKCMSGGNDEDCVDNTTIHTTRIFHN